jgi:hypothetical protein
VPFGSLTLEYKLLKDRLVVADSTGFAMDINEFGGAR